MVPDGPLHFLLMSLATRLPAGGILGGVVMPQHAACQNVVRAVNSRSLER